MAPPAPTPDPADALADVDIAARRSYRSRDGHHKSRMSTVCSS